MVGVLEIIRQNIEFLTTGNTGEQVLGIAILIGAGAASFAGFALALRAAGLKDAKSMLRGKDI